MNRHPKTAFRSFRMMLAVCMIATMLAIGLSTPVHAGWWDQLKELYRLQSLVGKGGFIEYSRDRVAKDPPPPVGILSDGFKMIRVYQNFPGNYLVEWTWRVFLKNGSSREVEMILEYTLQDEDDLLVAASKDTLRRVAAGESVMVEKTDHLPYDQAKRAVSGRGEIHLQD